MYSYTIRQYKYKYYIVIEIILNLFNKCSRIYEISLYLYSVINKQTLEIMTLKFKRHTDYIGRYLAEGEYRGYKVRVEIAKYEQGGFNYTTYLNGELADSYGHSGLRKSEILATIDEVTMADIDEKIRYRNL